MKIIQNTRHAILHTLRFIAEILRNGYAIPSAWQPWKRTLNMQRKNIHHLADKTCVELRLIGPQDRKRYLNGFSHISSQTNINRFHTFKTGFTDKELRYLLDIDNVRHLAIGAIRCNRNNLGIGIARYISQADNPTTAEAAIVVIDEYQGKGLGTLLYHELMARALENGITTFNNTVLKSNRPMLHILEQMGAQQISETQQVYELELQLSSPIETSDLISTHKALYKPLVQHGSKIISYTAI